MADRIDTYLDQLRASLRGADPALVQDAVFDAGEYLRAALEGAEGERAEAVLESAISDYGQPDEVAAAYREVEETVSGALRTPRPRPATGRLNRLLGVFRDPRTLAAYTYLLTAIVTGFAYFFLAVGGGVLGVSLIVFIIGIPYLLLYVGVIRAVSLAEGRIVETLLGERMPRRPLLGTAETRWIDRFRHWFTERRTWTTILYLAAQLPLGIAYLVVFGLGLVASVWSIVMPVAQAIGDVPFLPDVDGVDIYLDGGAIPLVMVAGVAGVFTLFHLARWVGRIHGRYAKWMLVGSLQAGKAYVDA